MRAVMLAVVRAVTRAVVLVLRVKHKPKECQAPAPIVSRPCYLFMVFIPIGARVAHAPVAVTHGMKATILQFYTVHFFISLRYGHRANQN